jgi:hypothetical protein
MCFAAFLSGPPALENTMLVAGPDMAPLKLHHRARSLIAHGAIFFPGDCR